MPTLLATPEPARSKLNWDIVDDSGLMVGPGSGYGNKKVSSKKRVRRSKFYKSLTVGPFGFNPDRFHTGGKYLVELKDGRFYAHYFSGKRVLLKDFNKGEPHGDYNQFRGNIKSGAWIETTMEKELAAQ